MENKNTPSIAEEYFNVSQSFIEHEMHADALEEVLEQISRSAHRGFLQTWIGISDIHSIRKAPIDYGDGAFNKLAENLVSKGFKTAFKTEGSGLLRQRVMHISWDMREEEE